MYILNTISHRIYNIKHIFLVAYIFVARSLVNLQPVSLVDQAFFPLEPVCVRASTTSGSITPVVLYRPGSAAPSTAFVDDVSSIVERLIVLSGPVYIADDFNVRFDRVDDQISGRLRRLFDSSDLSL